MTRTNRISQTVSGLQRNEIPVINFHIAKNSDVEDDSVTLAFGVELQINRGKISVNYPCGPLLSAPYHESNPKFGETFNYRRRRFLPSEFRTVEDALPTIRKALKDSESEWVEMNPVSVG